MLRVDNLSFSFKHRPLFQNLSFEVAPGTLTRIAGSNGAGKSTLLAIITGLISGASGDVSFDGNARAHVDFRFWTSWIAPDGNGFTASLSAIKNLEFWLQLRGLQRPHEHLKDSLNQWGLTGDWVQSELPVGKFSTGMKRRLAIVRLQLEGSKLWLLDEPLFGLDDAACRQFRGLLHQHIKSGGSAIVITHDDRLLDQIPHKTITLGGLVS
jgi:heme exporter protein A